MNRQPVSSSNIASIGYDAATELLEVEFLNGGLYHYFNVPNFIFDELMAAPSRGIYLNANIKPNYQYAKV